MPSNEIMSMEGQLVGMPLAGPESFSQQQLAYLKRALGVDETVLWEGAVNATGTNMLMSESVKNFSHLKVFVKAKNNSIGRGIQITECEPIFSENSPTLLMYINALDRAASVTTQNTVYLQFTDATTASLLAGSKWAGNTFTNSISTYDFYVCKIVGIHRISGGN